jgi:hypothetical protein
MALRKDIEEHLGTTGKGEFAMCGNVCLAQYIWRTAKVPFAMR